MYVNVLLCLGLSKTNLQACYLQYFVLILLFKINFPMEIFFLCYPGQCQSGVEICYVSTRAIQVDIPTITIMLVLALLPIKLMFSVQIPHNYNYRGLSGLVELNCKPRLLLKRLTAILYSIVHIYSDVSGRC